MSYDAIYRRTGRLTKRQKRVLQEWTEVPESDVTLDGDLVTVRIGDGWPARDALPTTDPEDC